MAGAAITHARRREPQVIVVNVVLLVGNYALRRLSFPPARQSDSGRGRPEVSR
jgi:hypothetical protein